ncbi:thioredoxin family protein [Marinospirillum perlucidum]|uniref:thioredoxin family protein n=1 Tax=Marinospirillum perlucidum TaxID=1982602 RepID=UPI000DF148FE|nr:thioredoxin family protein [Marinospirillum perlucidum]
MLEITTREDYQRLLTEEPALLVLYGGKNCGVCQAIKPRLAASFKQEFPAMTLAYLDCQGASLQLCASNSIFSLPVVELRFAGQLFSQFIRAFSLGEVMEAARRPYELLQEK